MTNVVYSAFLGLIVSMSLALLGYHSVWIHGALALLASLPFALLLYKERGDIK